MMKKGELATLVILGIGAGLLTGGCQEGSGGASNNKASADEQLGSDMQAFYHSLSSESKEKFLQLDAQHRMMAIEMSQQNCASKNKCAGFGGCETQQHHCAGQNACKGHGSNPIRDPNKAVEIQYQNQTGQRQKTNAGMRNPG